MKVCWIHRPGFVLNVTKLPFTRCGTSTVFLPVPPEAGYVSIIISRFRATHLGITTDHRRALSSAYVAELYSAVATTPRTH